MQTRLPSAGIAAALTLIVIDRKRLPGEVYTRTQKYTHADKNTRIKVHPHAYIRTGIYTASVYTIIEYSQTHEPTHPREPTHTRTNHGYSIVQ